MKFSRRAVVAGLMTLAAAGAPTARAGEAADADGPGAAVLGMPLPDHGPVLRPRPPLRPIERPTPGRGSEALWGVGVVELPSQSMLPGVHRPHHALNIPSDSPRRLLRSIGVDATECATRVRLPTQLKQAGGGLRADVQGQLLFNCRF